MNNRGKDMKYHRHLNCYRRATANESVSERHVEVLNSMRRVAPPLGWGEVVVPSAPEFGQEIYAGFTVSYPGKRLTCHGGYAFRSAEYLSVDQAARDDHLFFEFDSRDLKIDFQQLIHTNTFQVIEAFEPYRAGVGFFSYDVLYEQRNESEVKRLRRDPAIDVDGRNNIFTLESANFWEAKLCQRALGYGRDEVIRRLHGKVPRVEPFMDGVYTVFNDNPDLTFEEYCAYNDALKPVLGLV